MRRALIWTPSIVILGFMVFAGISAALAQESSKSLIEKINRSTVTMITGDVYSTGALMAQDLATVVNSGIDRRLLPVLGINSVQNVADGLYLKGVDMALVHADTLQRLDQNGKIPDVKRRLQYIAQLGLDKVFIIAGTAYTDVRDLSGKPVNLGPGDSAGTTSGLVLEALGVEVKPVAIDHRLAIELIKKGELAATVLVGADLRKLFVNVQPSKDLQLLPIAFDEPPAPYVQYVLKGSQLPGLVRSDTNYETVAVPLVLVTNSWQPNNFRYQRVQDFVKAMFAGFAELRQPLHAAEWQDVDLAAELPDWQRFEPAQEALANYQPDSGQFSQMQELFSQFVVTVGTDAAKLNEEDRGKLFDQFLRLLDDTVSTKIVVRLVTSSGVGADAGTLTLSNTKFSVAGRVESGLLIVPDLKGMEPGAYALHVHENPQCGPKLKDGVMVAGLAAGTHLWLSGTGALKGKQFTSHLGDLPDLVVNADQTATGDIVAARLSLADVYNRSIVIHANNDDTSPRFACGMFR